MKIDSRSWHYKIWELSGWDRSSLNLCRYFWGVMFNLFCMASVIPMILFLIYSLFDKERLLFMVIGLFISSLMWAFIFLIKKKLKKKNKGTSSIRHHSLILEYIKSKKDKVCPRIEIDYGR